MKNMSKIMSFVLIILLSNNLFAQEDILNAARQNRFDIVKKILLENKDLINSKDNRNCTFKDDLKYLAEKYKRVDISFMFLAGETTTQSVKIMEPKIAFPMHGFGLDYLYKNFPEKIRKISPSTRVFCPEFEGDVFFYKQ